MIVVHFSCSAFNFNRSAFLFYANSSHCLCFYRHVGVVMRQINTIITATERKLDRFFGLLLCLGLRDYRIWMYNCVNYGLDTYRCGQFANASTIIQANTRHITIFGRVCIVYKAFAMTYARPVINDHITANGFDGRQDKRTRRMMFRPNKVSRVRRDVASIRNASQFRNRWAAQNHWNIFSTRNTTQKMKQLRGVEGKLIFLFFFHAVLAIKSHRSQSRHIHRLCTRRFVRLNWSIQVVFRWFQECITFRERQLSYFDYINRGQPLDAGK